MCAILVIALLLSMPTRMIREGWIESRAVENLSAEGERFFLRLCLKADDYGRFHAEPVLLKSHLFPRRETVRATDISACLMECEKAGLVRCYEVAGERYLVIEKFNQRLRRKTPRFPTPPWEPFDPPADVGQMPDECPQEAVTVSEAVTETVNEVEEKRKLKAVNCLSGLTALERERLERTEKLVGYSDVLKNGKLWLTLHRNDPATYEKVLREVESMAREQHIPGRKFKKGPGPTFTDLYKRWTNAN